MGLTDFFLKMNVATGGKNPNDALTEGLRGLGLQPTRVDGAYSEYAGWYQRRQAYLVADGRAVTGTANGAYAQAAGLGMASAMGLVSHGFADWKGGMNDLRARNNMRQAQMMFRWVLKSPVPVAGGLRMGRDPSAGPPLGGDLFGTIDPAIWARVMQPHIGQVLSQARFHWIEVAGMDLAAIWSPPMSEYQQIAASPEAFTRTHHASFHMLSALADALCGPA